MLDLARLQMGSLDWANCFMCPKTVLRPYMHDFEDGYFGALCEECEDAYVNQGVEPFSCTWMHASLRDRVRVYLMEARVLPPSLRINTVATCIANNLYSKWRS